MEEPTQWARSGDQMNEGNAAQWDLGRGICWARHIFYVIWIIIQCVVATGWPKLAGPQSYVWTGANLAEKKGFVRLLKPLKEL